MNQRALLGESGGQNALMKLEQDLTAAVPGLRITVLSHEPLTGSFRGLPGSTGSDHPCGHFLDATDPIIGRFLAGDEWATWEYEHHTFGDSDEKKSSSAVVFPIVVNGHIDHLIVLNGRSLKDGDIRLIGGFCRQTALALETLAMQLNLNRKIERLASLINMVDDVYAEQSYLNLIQTVLERSAELLLAEQGSIMMIEKETDGLLLQASKGALMEADLRVRVPKGIGIAGWVAESGEPILVEDVEHDPRIGKKNRAKYKTSSFVSVPLKIDKRVVGVMNFSDKTTGEFFDDVDLRLAQTCANHAAAILDRKEMREQAEMLKQQAITDQLTGLFNRGCVLNRLREELSRSDRYAKTMSLIMLDVDGFKSINDLFGHAAGDCVLRKISDVMTDAMRSIDIIGRYGGDEFLIILPETDAFFAVHMAERVRRDIASADFSREIAYRTMSRITVSMGIATFPFHGTSPEVLVEHADEALYRAKAGGRDRVVVY